MGGLEGDIWDGITGPVDEFEFGVPIRFGFVLELEYFKGDCKAAAKTGCLSSIPSGDSKDDSFGDGIRLLS